MANVEEALKAPVKYAAVLRLVDRVEEKMVGLKLVSMTPLDLLPLMLANGGEEV